MIDAALWMEPHMAVLFSNMEEEGERLQMLKYVKCSKSELIL